MIIRPAEARDIDAIVALLHTYMNPKFTPERWRRLFSYDWCPDRPDFGRVAESQGEIVGCIAAVYSDRLIAGRPARVVNPAAWYLRKDARSIKRGLGHGIGYDLLADLSANPDWHYLINTSSKTTTRLLRRSGYRVLDDAKYVWRTRKPLSTPNDQTIAIITDRDVIMSRVQPTEQRILNDHAALSITPVLVDAHGTDCLMIFAETSKGEGEQWFDVLYVRDPAFLSRHGQAITSHLLDVPHKVMAADCRFCATPPPGAERVALDVARYIKSSMTLGAEADHLYSEIQLLDQKLR